MKKIYSLLKACMTGDMSLFKIKSSKGKNNKVLIGFVALCFMFSIWSYANILFEKLAPMHLQFFVLSIFVFLISIITVIEGIYKAGSLLFNCKDDNLLLSLPIKRGTVLLIRIIKFYLFELMFDLLFMIPLVVAYLRWADVVEWTFFLSSVVMLFMIPIIPIIISCIIGAFMMSLSSRFKYKKLVQTIISIIFLVFIMYFSYQLDDLIEYVAKHANSVFDFISKIYYPAGVYAKLVADFNVKDLLIFIVFNLSLFAASLYLLSLVYFKINSRIKKIVTSSSSKKTNIGDVKIKTSSVRVSLIKKEMSTFFNTPVFIINAGFGMVLYIIASIGLVIKYNEVLPVLTDPQTFNLSKDLINNNLSIIIFGLLSAMSFMTSITSSVISLEGKNISILKSLPVRVETILMSKLYAALVITTPILLIGDLILFVRFPISIVDMLLLLVLTVLIPCISHFIGLIVNLKFPKLDADNPTEVVKQSASSFVSVMIGMVLVILSIWVISNVIGKISATLFLLVATAFCLLLNFILFIYLKKVGTKEFSKLTV